jgi:glycosyltransferase involved in cell wall biosynthesis
MNANEFIEEGYKIGLCFKIYTDSTTSDKRHDVIRDFIKSINDIVIPAYLPPEAGNSLVIVGVIDCIVSEKLEAVLQTASPLIQFIRLNKNKGISFATNIGIEALLNHGCDYIFCADDDIVFQHPDVFRVYIQNMITSKIRHLVYHPSVFVRAFKQKQFHVGELIVYRTYTGCFYCVTRNAIFEHGYLPIMDGTYGYDHEQFTKTLTILEHDIRDSEKYVKLHDLSVSNVSGQRTINKMVFKPNLVKYHSPNFYVNSI